MISLEILDYRGYSITKMGDGFTVFFEGDEIYFDSRIEAINFIDEMED